MVSIGRLEFPIGLIGRAIQWPFRHLAGTPAVERSVQEIQGSIQALRQHISAMTEIMYLIIAEHMGTWSPQQREQVLRAIARFTLVNPGLDNINPKGNPITAEEHKRLKEYVRRAETNQPFSPDEATDFRQLTEQVVREHPNKEWVVDLLKISMLIYAFYVVGELFKPQPEPTK